VTLTPKPNGYEIRLRYGKGQRDRFLLRCDAATAAKREPRMEAMARKLSALVDDTERAKGLLQEAGAAAGDAKKFSAVERVVDKICAEAAGDTPPSAASGTLSTFRQVVDEWCSGRLHQQDPERVPFKNPRSLKQTREGLAVFLPVLGALNVAEIDDAKLKEAKKSIPAGLDPDSRRVYLSRLRSVFRLAVEPLDLIPMVPKEVRSVPPPKANRSLFWFLYPAEEAQLLACTAIPLCWRVLYAWLHRNGGRVTETSKIDYLHLDLERGRIRIEATWTKTGRARFWNLEADVLFAMRAWHQIDGEKPPEARVFHASGRKSYSSAALLDRLHSDLKLAGIHRDELFQTTRGSRKLRGHDFRTGFCTMARRRGMPDTWIMDRSGHESVANLERYAKLARSADEQDMPTWWAPMDEAIPELRILIAEARRVGQAWAKPLADSRKQAVSAKTPYSIVDSESEAIGQETPRKTQVGAPETLVHPSSGPASFQGVGQTGPGSHGVAGGPTVAISDPADPVEKALSYALEEATKDKRYDVVLAVTRELEQRRLARASSNVTSLDSRRKPRNGDKP
jgi:integrase